MKLSLLKYSWPYLKKYGKPDYTDVSTVQFLDRHSTKSVDITYYVDGSVCSISTRDNLKLCSFCPDEPALYYWHRDGKLHQINFMKDGVTHSYGDVPSYMVWSTFGELQTVEYTNLGESHRHYSLGPAVIKFNRNEWCYYFNGKLHRPASEGPARFFQMHPTFGVYEYYENQRFISKKNIPL